MVSAPQSPSSKCPLVLPRFSPEWFFPDGDLLLKCGSTTLYLVHSHLLASASQVFREAIPRRSVPSQHEIASIHKHIRHVMVSSSLQARLKSTAAALPRRMQRKTFAGMNKMAGTPKVLIVGDTENNMNLVLRFIYSKKNIPIAKDILPRLLSLGARYGIPNFIEMCISILWKKAITDALFVIQVCRDWVPEKDLLETNDSSSTESSVSSLSSLSSGYLYIQLTNGIKQPLVPIYKSAISVMLDRFPQYYNPITSTFPGAGGDLQCDHYEAYISSVPLEIQLKCFERWNKYKRDMERYLQWLFTAGAEPLRTFHHSHFKADNLDSYPETVIARGKEKPGEEKKKDSKIKQLLEVRKEALRNQIRNELRLFWSSETAVGTGTAGWKGTNTSYGNHNMNIPSPSRMRTFISIIHIICENACETFRREQFAGRTARQDGSNRNEDGDIVMRFNAWVHDFQEDNFRRISKMVLGSKKWWEWRVAAANAIEICPFLLSIGEKEKEVENGERGETVETPGVLSAHEASQQERRAGGERSSEVWDEEELSGPTKGTVGDGDAGDEVGRHHYCGDDDGDEDEDECMFESDEEIDEEQLEDQEVFNCEPL